MFAHVLKVEFNIIHVCTFFTIICTAVHIKCYEQDSGYYEPSHIKLQICFDINNQQDLICLIKIKLHSKELNTFKAGFKIKLKVDCDFSYITPFLNFVKRCKF